MFLTRASVRLVGGAAIATSVSAFGQSHASWWTASWTQSSGKKTAVSKVQPALAKPPLALQDHFDVVVVGGGIIGVATAREILRRFPGLSVCVLEKEAAVAPHQSSHNSGVIHAGMYYPTGSVMAKTCVRGAELMYEYCGRHGLPHSRIGKLIVASNPDEGPVVQKLFVQGTANGVMGLRVLNSEELHAMEPNVVGHSALWSPNTGIADYGAVTRYMASEVLETGRADIRLNFEAKTFSLMKQDGRDLVVIQGMEQGQKGPLKHILATNVITCAGLQADLVAGLGGGAPSPKVVSFRGTYYQMKQEHKDIVKTNIYPVPSGGGIPVGVHFTPTVNEQRGHQMIVGPGACIAFSREGYRLSDISIRDLLYSASNLGLWKFAIANPSLSVGELWKDVNKRAFLREAQKLVPGVTEDMIEPSFSGVMSQVFMEDGKAAKDFLFERRVLGGTTLHVRNAPSPAATASLAIAEHVVNIASEDFGWATKKQ